MKKLLLLVVALFMTFTVTACIPHEEEVETFDPELVQPALVGVTFSDVFETTYLLLPKTNTSLFMSVSAAESTETYDFDAAAGTQNLWLNVHFYNYQLQVNNVEVNGFQWQAGMCEGQDLFTEGEVCPEGSRLVTQVQSGNKVMIQIPISAGDDSNYIYDYQVNSFAWTNSDNVPVNETVSGERTQARLYTHKAMPQIDEAGPQYNEETGELVIKLQNQDQAQVQIRVVGFDLVILQPDVDENSLPIVDEDGYYTYRYTVQKSDNGNGHMSIQFKLEFQNGIRQQDCLDQVEIPEEPVVAEE